MPYIICNEDGDYLKCDKKNKYSIVNAVDQAYKWSDIAKANNICASNVNGLIKKYHLQVKYISQENRELNPVAKPIELDYNILDRINELSDFSKQLEERRLYLIELIQMVDLDIVDIEHAAEFYVLNASQGYKIYKMLHNARVKRRQYKNELQKIDYTLGTHIDSSSLHNLEKKILGLDNRQYTPRVNEELFGV